MKADLLTLEALVVALAIAGGCAAWSLSAPWRARWRDRRMARRRS